MVVTHEIFPKQRTLLNTILACEQVREVARHASANLPAVVGDDVVEGGLRQGELALVGEVEALEDFACGTKVQMVQEGDEGGRGRSKSKRVSL